MDAADESEEHVENTPRNPGVVIPGAYQENSPNSEEVKSDQETPIETKKQKWSELELQDRAIVLLTFGLFLIAGVTAVIFLKQVYLMEDQLDEMRGGGQQTERLVILNTGQMTNAARTASAAQIQANAAQDSVNAIKRQMQQDQRAWVSVDVSEKTGKFAVAMKNTGKTPALNVIYEAQFSGGPRGQPPEILPNIRKDPLHFVVAPGEARTASDWAGPYLGTFNTKGDRNYVQGDIVYDDIFGKTHHTVYCYWTEPPPVRQPGVVPPSTFTMCGKHNKMD